MDQPNIILIILDTLRKDVLPMYGGNAYTPNLSEFAKDAVVFQNAIAPAPWTLPSHASFFTGLYPREHGIHDDCDEQDYRKLLNKIDDYNGKNLIKDLKNKGYNTVGFSANPVISSYSGFDKYFNLFISYPADYVSVEVSELFKKLHIYGNNKNKIELAMDILSNEGFRALKNYYDIYKKFKRNQKIAGFPYNKQSDNIVNNIIESSFEQPFFMFINFMEVHEPVSMYEVKNNPNTYMDIAGIKLISEKNMNKIRAGYKKSLKNLDQQFGRLMKFLKKLKIYENTLIIVTSDHGQAFKEPQKYPFYGHAGFLYDEIIKVPLIIKFPNNLKIEKKEGYQNLIYIPSLIENVMDGNYIDSLTREVTFSESFAGPNFKNLLEQNIISRKKFEELMNKFCYPRKAVYKNGYKLVINGLNGEIDEFRYKEKNIDPKENKDVLDDLLDELDIFKGIEKFVVKK